MSVTTLPSPAPATAETPSDPRPVHSSGVLDRYFSSLVELTSQPPRWDRASYSALGSLIVLWAIRVYTSWATWGYLPVDTGREMYVPALLAQGKMLYRDVFFGYTPLAPYINALLFHTFGMRLEVLYWAGSLAALGCAILVFLTGRRLGSSLAGWTAGAIILMETFHAWHFSFPLAYSFSSVYGCLAACTFFWCAVNACRSRNPVWMFAAANLAALAVLIKLEYGAACYAAFALLVVAQAWHRRSFKSLAPHLAASMPGLLVCAFVARWMFSINGFTFITQENLASTWPGSFFMKTYGRAWLESTGLAVTPTALLQSFLRAAFFAGVLLEGYLLFWRRRFTTRCVLQCATLLAGLAAYAFFAHKEPLDTFTAIFFPQDMVIYVSIAAVVVWWRMLRTDDFEDHLPLALALSFAVLLAFRTLLKTTATGYSIFYNGPVVLSFLILVRPIVPRVNLPRRAILRAELLLCLGSLAVVSVYAARFTADMNDRDTPVTERGSIVVPIQLAENYRPAIALMKQEAAAGRAVLSVPEDTSLYFLSGTEAPSRLYFFAPGMLVPGAMTRDTLQQIEQKHVRYVLWSNRNFPEYGVPRFGVDFDRTLGDYLNSHYRLVGPLVKGTSVEWHVRFFLWERKPDVPFQ